jgi:DNA-directed RNA polymerase alpha subunit
MKINIEITDIYELIKLRDWLNAMPEFEDKPKFDLSQSIDVLEFTVRTKNCLLAEKIETVGDLIKWSRVDLLKTQHMGKKSLLEIIDALSIHGLYLMGDSKPNVELTGRGPES